MRTLEEEIEIRVTLPENERRDPSQLGSLRIPNGRGNLIRLGQVAQSERGQGVAAYEHENNWRQVTITGDLNESLTDSKTVNATIRDTLVPEMEKRFPGISYSFGGEEQDTAESMVSLQRAFFIAGMGIIFILILIFQNLWQPILIGLTIPLGIMSVIWTFLVHDRPLSFLAMVGVIALAGVIVNNAIVLVSFVNNLRKEGEDKLESIKKAASMRLRPIFLTTLTTVAGILPTAYGWGGLDPFVVPIALALGWGIAFGSVLTTIAFPAFLAVMDDIQGFFARIVSRGAKP
jgi:multidrug efflux pump subunit AcrB